MKEEELIEIGFRHIGECKFSCFSENQFEIQVLPSIQKERKVVYAISVDGEITYVGKTNRGLLRRFTAYRNDKKYNNTDGRIGMEIRSALRNKSIVKVFVWVDENPWQLGPLTVNRYTAVEETIINHHFLPWNKSG